MNLLKKNLLLVIAVSLSVPFLAGCSNNDDLDPISAEEVVLEEALDSEEEDILDDELDSEDVFDDELDTMQEENNADTEPDIASEKESRTESMDSISEEANNVQVDQNSIKEKSSKNFDPEQAATMFLDKLKSSLNDLVEDGTIDADNSQAILDAANTSLENDVLTKDILSTLVADGVITLGESDAILENMGLGNRLKPKDN